MRMMRKALWPMALGVLMIACGGAPAPNERVASATAAVRAAEVGGAQQDPEATLLLKRANEGLAKAKSLMEDGKNKEADWVLQRAEVDADLALNLAREAAAKADAQSALDQVQALKKQQSE
jgi:Domain of unknown function (DUF4398)